MQAPDYKGLTTILLILLTLSIFGVWKLISLLIWLFTHISVSVN